VSHFFKLSAENPVLQLLALIGALVVLGLAFVLGFVVIAVLAGIAVVALLVLRLKMSWRKWRGGPELIPRNAPQESSTSHQATIIEAEYKVVSRDED